MYSYSLYSVQEHVSTGCKGLMKSRGFWRTGCAENELGLRDFLESRGIQYVVTPDKEGPDSEFDRQLVDADVIITTPFHPGTPCFSQNGVSWFVCMRLQTCTFVGGIFMRHKGGRAHALIIAQT